MPQHYSSGKKIYSVDMMFAYLSIFKHEAVDVDVDNYLDVNNNGWGDPLTGDLYSVSDVLNNKEKYEDDTRRIKNADLRFPIILEQDEEDDINVVDGIHRLT
jgi:hypothetical protein